MFFIERGAILELQKSKKKKEKKIKKEEKDRKKTAIFEITSELEQLPMVLMNLW